MVILFLLIEISLYSLTECRRELSYNGDMALWSTKEPPPVWEQNMEYWNPKMLNTIPVSENWGLYDQSWLTQPLRYPSASMKLWYPFRSNQMKTLSKYSFGEDEKGKYLYIPGKPLDDKRNLNFPWNYKTGMLVPEKNKYIRKHLWPKRRLPIYKYGSLRKTGNRKI